MSDLQHHDAARNLRAAFIADADRRAANAARYVGAELSGPLDALRVSDAATILVDVLFLLFATMGLAWFVGFVFASFEAGVRL
jgi:hypothetical protein